MSRLLMPLSSMAISWVWRLESLPLLAAGISSVSSSDPAISRPRRAAASSLELADFSM
ncbi:hypothetical protein D9M69_673380 [compost metagenome]